MCNGLKDTGMLTIEYPSKCCVAKERNWKANISDMNCDRSNHIFDI